MGAGVLRLLTAMPALACACAPACAADAPAGEVQGFAIGGGYVSDTLADVTGGIDPGVTELGKADLTLRWSGRLLGADHAQAYLDLEYALGRSFSTYRVGDVQTVSNIDAVSALRPFEAWLRLPLALGGVGGTVTAGLVDLNGIFDVQSVGHLFINSSHGIGPDFSHTGRNGPSIFPTTSPAIVAELQKDAWTLRLGAFEAVAGDPEHLRRTVVRLPGRGGGLLVVEVERAVGPGQVQVGAWSYTGRYPAIDGSGRKLGGDHGVYALVERRLAGTEQGPSLDGWLRAGLGQARINAIGSYVGGGLAYGTQDGKLGLALARARLGDPGYRALATAGGRPHRAELDIELTYSRRVARWLRVQPDAQYVAHPSWRGDIPSAAILGLRLIFEPFP